MSATDPKDIVWERTIAGMRHDRKRCPCVRCRGFQPGNSGYGGGKPQTHGAYATPLKLKPEADAIAEIVRPHMPVWHPAFEGTLQSYCILLARIQRAHDALEAAEDGTWDEEEKGKPPGQYLAEEVRKWTSSALKHATQLGLTPASAAQILRDTKGGGPGGQFRPPSQQELDRVPLDSLHNLQRALTEALQAANTVEGSAIEIT